MQSSLSWSASRIAIAAWVALVAACARDETAAHAPRPDPFEVVSDPAQLVLSAGSAGSISAQVNDSNGQPIGGASLSYESLDPELLRVSATGEVSSLGRVGRGEIRISSGAREVKVPVDINPGAPNRIELTQSAPSVIAGIAAESQVTARVLDAYANPVARSAVSFEIGVDPPVTLTAESDATGLARVSLPSIERAGQVTLRVRSASDTTVEAAQDITVTPAAAARFVPVEYPADNVAAANEVLAVVLRAIDAYDNPVPAVQVHWRAGPRSGRVEPAESTSGPDGLVRAHWSLSEVKPGPASLRAVSADHESVALVMKLEVRAARAN